MARPEKESCDFFFTSTKLLYDTKIKALRRSFKDSGNANNAFFVFDYLFREIFGNEGYYIRYTEDLVGDTADFCYLPESFVKAVIEKCTDIGLFHKGQLEKNGILTSRAIQRKYEKITEKRKHSAIESRFYVLDEELMSEETELMSSLTPLMTEESTHRKERKETKEKERESDRNFSLPFSDDSQTMTEVKRLITDERLVETIRKYIESRYTTFHDTIDGISVCVLVEDLLRHTPDTEKQIKSVENAIAQRWKKFYPPSDENKKEKPKPDKSKIIQPDEEVGTWSWQQPETT